MRRPLGFALMLSFMATVLSFGSASSQPGTLLQHLKINDATMAGHGVSLTDGDEFADAVASLGDLDGPGPSVAALAVGTIGDDDGGTHRGAVYILFLDAAGNVLSYRKISGTQGGFTGMLDHLDEFGGAVTSLGDLDGPGPSVQAIAVGAIGDDDGGTDRGCVYVLFLDATGAVLSHRKISDTEGNFTAPLDDLDEFGGAVAGLGDLDGAGPSAGALAVGVIGDDDGGPNRGACYILFLGTDGHVMSYRKISDTSGGFTGQLGDNDNFGEDATSLGDIDGPGPSVLAVAIAAVDDDDGGNDRGAVYVMFLNASGDILSYRKISNGHGGLPADILQNDDNFGSAVSAMEDLDGSGPSVVTLVVGAGSDDGIGFNRGATYLLFLDQTGLALSYQEISTTAGNFNGKLADEDEFGSALAALGDIDGNGPGRGTLAVGVGVDDGGGIDRGAVYLLTFAGGGVAATDDRPDFRSNAWVRVQPNPFRRGTMIPFSIAEAGRVALDVWDVRGRRVRTLVQEHLVAGAHRLTWDGLDDSGRSVPVGVYYVQMSVNGRAMGTGAKAVVLK